MRKRYTLEIGSCEETEVESLDEEDGGTVEEKPHPPIWHRRCRQCGTVYNVLRRCPQCGKR